jgi:hypothetical protein
MERRVKLFFFEPGGNTRPWRGALFRLAIKQTGIHLAAAEMA